MVNLDTFPLAENGANGTEVGTITASDPDAGTVLTWLITAGNASGAFAINSSTGQLTVATRNINVTAVNDPPVLSQPANQPLGNNQTLPVTLTVSDPDAAAASLVYTAGFEDQGYVLKQQHGFGAEATSSFNWSGNQQEKWFNKTVGATVTWYFILPNGDFYQWGGGTKAQLITNSTQLGPQLHTVYYTTTTRLSSPTSIAASAAVNNSSPPAVLTVDPPDTFIVTLRFDVSISDGAACNAKTFYVTVNQVVAGNNAPTLAGIEGTALGYTENGAATAITWTL